MSNFFRLPNRVPLPNRVRLVCAAIFVLASISFHVQPTSGAPELCGPCLTCGASGGGVGPCLDRGCRARGGFCSPAVGELNCRCSVS